MTIFNDIGINKAAGIFTIVVGIIAIVSSILGGIAFFLHLNAKASIFTPEEIRKQKEIVLQEIKQAGVEARKYLPNPDAVRKIIVRQEKLEKLHNELRTKLNILADESKSLHDEMANLKENKPIIDCEGVKNLIGKKEEIARVKYPNFLRSSGSGEISISGFIPIEDKENNVRAPSINEIKMQNELKQIHDQITKLKDELFECELRQLR